MEESSEADKETENGEKTKAINEENIAKAAAASLAAAAVKAKVGSSWVRGIYALPISPCFTTPNLPPNPDPRTLNLAISTPRLPYSPHDPLPIPNLPTPYSPTPKFPELLPPPISL